MEATTTPKRKSLESTMTITTSSSKRTKPPLIEDEKLEAEFAKELRRLERNEFPNYPVYLSDEQEKEFQAILDLFYLQRFVAAKEKAIKFVVKQIMGKVEFESVTFFPLQLLFLRHYNVFGIFNETYRNAIKTSLLGNLTWFYKRLHYAETKLQDPQLIAQTNYLLGIYFCEIMKEETVHIEDFIHKKTKNHQKYGYFVMSESDAYRKARSEYETTAKKFMITSKKIGKFPLAANWLFRMSDTIWKPANLVKHSQKETDEGYLHAAVYTDDLKQIEKAAEKGYMPAIKELISIELDETFFPASNLEETWTKWIKPNIFEFIDESDGDVHHLYDKFVNIQTLEPHKIALKAQQSEKIDSWWN